MCIVLLAGCSSFGDGTAGVSETSNDAPTGLGNASDPAQAKISGFCSAIDALNVALEADLSDGGNELIIETYTALIPEVPPELAADFKSVLEALIGGDRTIPTTLEASTDPASSSESSVDEAAPTSSPTASIDPATLDEEGVLPSATPAERVQDYIVDTCLGVGHNPGPPATVPA